MASPTAGGVIAETKLHIPAARPGLVSRAALVEALSSDEVRKLTLLDAPPGFGKTTLLAEWHASDDEDRAFAWLSLDAADNDPVRFWSCVVKALQTVEPSLGASAAALLGVRNVRLDEMVLPLLLNELAALSYRLVLVLDDYHLITDSRVQDSVIFLLDHLPDTLEIALATRSDPPLPLGRLRARGELLEIRARDLRFSDREAAELLNRAQELELDAADVERLQSRTEGWAAGLYLAALSLRGRTDRPAFIESFAGDDRQIADYLLSEVLEGQPPDLRTFLTRTSVLDRLCGPLCDAVCSGRSSAAVLADVERDNLFLVPLDTRRGWYRYHHLFRDLLRQELRRAEPELIPELHRRAAVWFRAQGAVPDTIHHVGEAGDTRAARELTAEHWNSFFNLGHLETVARWLDALPVEEVEADPRLCVARAWLAVDAGRVTDVERWIAAADEAIRSADEDASPAAADTAVLRAVHRFKVGDVGEAGRAAKSALGLASDEAAFARTVARTILGIAEYWSGRVAASVAALEEAVAMARRTDNHLAAAYVLGYLAVLRLEEGEVDEAARLAHSATSLSDAPGFAEHFVLMMGHLAHGLVSERRGHLGRANGSLERAAELSGRGAGTLEVASANLALGRVKHSLGDSERARELLKEARRRTDACPDPGQLPARVAMAERTLRLGGSAARRGDRADVDELTDRELAVLRLLSSELTLREIGTELFVSHNTVKTHSRSVYRKLAASNREEAVNRARELNVLD
jgi:LuxR family transcriptional regulator, maltose regulon positive regulatory protein